MNIEATTKSIKDSQQHLKDKKYKEVTDELGKALSGLEAQKFSKFDPLALLLFLLFLIGYGVSLN